MSILFFILIIIFLIIFIFIFVKNRKEQSNNLTKNLMPTTALSFEHIDLPNSRKYSVIDNLSIDIPDEMAEKTKSEIAEMAFDHIFKTIECDITIKQKIRNEYVNALIKQQYDRYHDILRFNLAGVNFKWKWFDDWKGIFIAADKWPAAWNNLNYDEITVPENIHAILEFVKVAEIRKVLKEKGIKKIPTSRIQVQELALIHLTVNDLQEAIKERVSYFEALRDRNNQQTILYLIERSISHTQSQLSELVNIMQIKQEKPQLELKDIVYLSPSWGEEELDRWVLEQVDDSVNNNSFPPYYPGDSISIRLDYSVRY